MTPEKKSLDNYSTFEISLKVKLADDRVLYAYGKDDIHLTVLNGNDKINIVIKDVLFVPNVKTNAFFSRELQKKKLLLNSKINHAKSRMMESSAPSAISTASFTN